MLYGKNLRQADLTERTGSLAQFAGIHFYTLENGVERGAVACSLEPAQAFRWLY